MVAVRIRNMMVSAASRAVVCSAACGADILALEGAAQLGLGRRVVLPFSRQQFRELLLRIGVKMGPAVRAFCRDAKRRHSGTEP